MGWICGKILTGDCFTREISGSICLPARERLHLSPPSSGDLNQLEGDFWIRVLYTHPAHWTDELIATIASCDKVAKYVDIPLQHIHPTMLERMRRETSRDYIEKLLERIRKGIPGIAIRTTFIVGFPGETEGCFQSLLDFIQATRFERMGVFTYSHEEGTRAGGMANAIDDSEKAHRRDRAMAIQRDISRAWASEQVGKTFKVLIEAQADEKTLEDAMVRSWEHGHLRSDQEPQAPALLSDEPWMVARGQADAPDIDGLFMCSLSMPTLSADAHHRAYRLRSSSRTCVNSPKRKYLKS